VDLTLGHLSYPLFLVHVPVMWIGKHFAGVIGPHIMYRAIWAGSLALSAAIYFGFDRAVNALRKSRRQIDTDRRIIIGASKVAREREVVASMTRTLPAAPAPPVNSPVPAVPAAPPVPTVRT
jgi:peptidoglycan/LPS O-acetylase OafA/YrhL